MIYKIKIISFALTFLLMGKVFATENLVGQQAPKITVSKWVTAAPPIADRLDGKVYVVEFCATWCQPCMRAIPHMKELAKKYRSKEVFFISLSEDESSAKVKTMIDQKKIEYFVGMDDDTITRFKSTKIPDAFVIDHTGKITWQGNPADKGFERAISKTVKNAPPPFLEGLLLGEFESYRLDLTGGNSFAKAYQQIKLKAKNSNPQAELIIKNLEEKITKKIEDANNLRSINPSASIELYHKIAKNYSGAAATIYAQTVCENLKNDPNLQNELMASENLSKAEKLLSRCTPCQNCARFNPSCEKCIQANQRTVERTVQLLNICEKYKNATSVETAKKKLKEINLTALQTKKRSSEPNL